MKAKTIRSVSWLVGSLLLTAIYASIIIGVTFSIFTDSAASKNNHIQAGTLNVGLYMSEKTDAYTDANGVISEHTEILTTAENPDGLDLSVESNPMLSIDNALPGYYGERKLKLKNESTIQIGYSISVVTGGLEDDSDGALKDALTITITIGDKSYKYKGGEAIDDIVNLQLGVNVLPKTESPFTIRYELDETIGNEFQCTGVSLDFTVLATQVTKN